MHFDVTDGERKSFSVRQEAYIPRLDKNLKITIQWAKGIEAKLNGQEPIFDRSEVFPAYLEWRENPSSPQGWVNIRKHYSRDHMQNDSMLCWAMTASNMLHYWLEENKSEITAYLQKKGITEDSSNYKKYFPNYVPNADKTNPNDSDIAHFFIANVQNSPFGGDLMSSLNWYLFGRNDFKLAKNGITPPALFKDLLPENADRTFLVRQEGVGNKEHFEQVIKETLKNGDLLALEYSPDGRGLHIVTVWGASYTADGSIAELWVADSDIVEGVSMLQNRGIYYPAEKSGP